MAYEISDGLTAGLNVSHDFQASDHFETRVSADLKTRIGGASTTAMRKKVQQLPVINALTSTPSNRDLRVHDALTLINIPGGKCDVLNCDLGDVHACECISEYYASSQPHR